MGKLRSLQVLRFLAALGVMWEHAVAQTGPGRFTGGQAGVDVFFVLSGFVISHAASARPTTFLRDRLTRIYPTYWLWAVGWVALAAVDWPISGWPVFTTLTLLPAPTSNPLSSYVHVGWTLSFEMLFYLGVWATLRGLSRWFVVVGYVGLAVTSMFTQAPIFKFFGSPMVLEFGLGVLAYHLGRGKPAAGTAALITAALVFALLPRQLLLTQASLESNVALRVAFIGPLAFMVVWGAAQFDCASRLWRPLSLLGDASYSIYLFHALLMDAASRITGHPSNPIAAMVLCVAVGLVAYLLVERPLLGLVRQLTARPAVQAAPA